MNYHGQMINIQVDQAKLREATPALQDKMAALRSIRIRLTFPMSIASMLTGSGCKIKSRSLPPPRLLVF